MFLIIYIYHCNLFYGFGSLKFPLTSFNTNFNIDIEKLIVKSWKLILPIGIVVVNKTLLPKKLLTLFSIEFARIIFIYGVIFWSTCNFTKTSNLSNDLIITDCSLCTTFFVTKHIELCWKEGAFIFFKLLSNFLKCKL